MIVIVAYKQAAGMALGAACYFDCSCICCVVMCSKFDVYFMLVCCKLGISISMLLLAYSQNLA